MNTIEKEAKEIQGKIMKMQDTELRDFILANVRYMLVNKERNAERLKDLLYRDFLDLAVIYTVVSETDGGYFTMKIGKAVADIAGITREDIEEASRRNTLNSGFKVLSVTGVIFDDEDEEQESGGEFMYVITNNSKVNGATSLLYNDVLDRAAKKLSEEIYILPSSVHELIAISAGGDCDPGYLKTMVSDINETDAVSDKEILGNTVYKYNSRSKELSIVA